MRAPALVCVVACLLFGAQPALAQSPADQTITPTPPATAPSIQPSGLRATAQPLAGGPPTAAQSVATFWAPLNAQPPGHKVGNWTFFPMVTAAALFDDNVFATHANKQKDWLFVIRPELAVTNTGQNHAFEAHAFVEKREYAKFDNENQVNGAASVGGTVLLNPDTQFQGRAQYFHGHEERGVGEAIVNGTIFPQTLKPIAFDQVDVAAALNHRRDRWWTSIGAAATWIHFDNALLTDGTVALQDFRDGTIAAVPIRVGYVVAPFTSVFVQGTPNRRDFNVNEFDSNGFHVVGGVLLEPGQGRRVRGEAYAGYMRQDYNGATFLPVSSWTFATSMAFLLTDRLTLTLQGRRDAKETAVTCLTFNVFIGCGSSLIESWGGARFDYLLLPNLVVGVGATYFVDEINDIVNGTKVDRYTRPLFSLRYFPYPWLTLGFDYRHVDFNSDRVGVLSYNRNVYMLSANAKF